MLILLSNSKSAAGRKGKQKEEEISHNHIQGSFPGPVELRAILIKGPLAGRGMQPSGGRK